MKYRLRVSSNAAAQIREAVRWWRSNRSAIDLLEFELQRGFDLIRNEPGVGAPASSKLAIPELRRLHLPRVRYSIYYRSAGADTIEVLAVWHTSRGSMPQL